MLTVKCPQCQAGIKLQQAPPAGKVKCPRCSAIVPVGIPRSGTPSQVASRVPARSGDPDDENFDFGNIQFPTAGPAPTVSHFPIKSNVSIYTGPIPGDPLGDAVQPSAPAGGSGGTGGAAGSGNATQPQRGGANSEGKKIPVKVLVAIGSGLVGFIVMFLLVSMMFGGGDDAAATAGGGSSVDVVAEAKKNVPAGFQVIGIEGCVVLMPDGDIYAEVPTSIESKIIQSSKTQSIYYFGAMDAGPAPLDDTQMRKKAEKLLGGDVLGGQPTQRNGYSGIKGMLSVCPFLPDMQVEIFLVDSRYVIIGCAAEQGSDGSEQATFYNSFKVGANSGGWFF